MLVDTWLCGTDTQARLRAARSPLSSLTPLWRNRINKSIKLRLYTKDSNMTTKALHGSEYLLT